MKTQILIICVLTVVIGLFGGIVYTNKNEIDLGGISIGQSASSTTMRLNATTSTLILTDQTEKNPSYTKICGVFTATTQRIDYLVATSSTDIAVAQEADKLGKRVSGILNIYAPCVEFVQGKNLTKRAIYGRATSTALFITVETR